MSAEVLENAFFKKEIHLKEIELKKQEDIEKGWIAKWLLKARENEKVLEMSYGTHVQYIAFKKNKSKHTKNRYLDPTIQIDKNEDNEVFTIPKHDDKNRDQESTKYIKVNETCINIEKYLLTDDKANEQNLRMLMGIIKKEVLEDLKNTKEYKNIESHIKGPGKKRAEAILRMYEEKTGKKLRLSNEYLMDDYVNALLLSKLCPNYKFFESNVMMLDFLTEFHIDGNILTQRLPSYLQLTEIKRSDLNFLAETLPKLINVEKEKIEMDLEDEEKNRLAQIPLTSYLGPSIALEIYTNSSAKIMELSNATIAGLYQNGLTVEKMKDCIDIIYDDDKSFTIVCISPLDGDFIFIQSNEDGDFAEILDSELKRDIKYEYLKGCSIPSE